MKYTWEQLRHNPSKAVQFPTTTASVALITTRCLLTGYSVIETTGTAGAQIDFHDGSGSVGELFDPIQLGAGTSRSDELPEGGLLMQRGVWLQVNSGSVRGAIWIKTFDFQGW